MATQTATKKQTPPAQAPARNNEIAHFQPARLPWHPAIQERFGVDKTQWKPLVEAIFPAAKSVDSVVMALSYCKARGLDPFKRPVHIVPIYDKAKRALVETVWPGIAELRTTAFRTGQYAGTDEAEFGPDVETEFTGRVKRGDGWEDASALVTYPEWCRITVYRELSGRICKFVGPKVYWLESYATQGASDIPNEMWQSRPRGQIEKCAEAAALRKAFPEEIGNTYAAEEVEGRAMDTTAEGQPVPERPNREQFKDVTPSRDPAPPEPTADDAAADAPADSEAREEPPAGIDPEKVLQDLIDQLATCSIPGHIDELIDENAETIAGFTPPEEATWGQAVARRRAAMQKGAKR